MAFGVARSVIMAAFWDTGHPAEPAADEDRPGDCLH
jgi:hypothetical protein